MATALPGLGGGAASQLLDVVVQLIEMSMLNKNLLRCPRPHHGSQATDACARPGSGERTCQRQGVIVQPVVDEHAALQKAAALAIHVTALGLHVVRCQLARVVPARQTPA